MKARHALLFCLAMVLALSAFVTAQVTKGSITGTVVDQTGAVVPDAQVTAKNVATGTTYTSKSDSSGNYRFSLIPPGRYTVQVSKTGFNTVTQQAVDVATGQVAGMGTVQLTVGNVSNTVEVTAETPLVENVQTQVSDTFSGNQLQNFSGTTENEGLDNLALFVPGVTQSRDNNFSNFNGVGFSVNGLRGRNNDQQIDGQNNNDNSVGGPALFLSNPEFVSEYNIVTNNFGPEYGRNAGSVVNIVTKAGTNNFHGSVFGTENNSQFNTLNYAQKNPVLTTPPLKKLPRANDEFSGFTLGGPILKNKLFFFGGFDNEIVSSSTVYETGNLTPTPTGLATLATCFAGSAPLAALQQFGPYAIKGGTPTPLKPTTVDLTGCPGVEFGGVQRTIATPIHTYDFIVRVDATGAKDTVSVRYLFNHLNSFGLDPGSGLAAAGYPFDNPDQNQQWRVSWTHNLTSKMVNEIAGTYGRLNTSFGGNSIGNTTPPIGQIANGLAAINTGQGNLSFGPQNIFPQGRIVNTYQVQDNWNYLAGKHQLKAGVNYTYQRSPNIFLPNINGSYNFTSWDNYFANTPGSVSVTAGNPNLDFREHDTFLYVGDEWKITPSLTINGGLTWTYYGQPANIFHNQDLKRETGSQPFFDPSLPLSLRVFPSIPAPKNSFGPSIGFAWSPAGGSMLTGGPGKTVIRGGYRLAYDPPFYNIYLNIASSAPQVLAQTLTATAPPLPAVPTGPNVRAAAGPDLTFGVFDPRRFNQSTITPNFGPDKVNSWSFGIQRELSKNAALEVRYVGNHAYDLFQSINANPRIAGFVDAFPNLFPGATPCPASSAVVPTATGRVNCNEGVVRERTNTGYSYYNGLQTELRTQNLWNQLMIRASYTFSKTTDNVSEIFSTASGGNTSAFSQNPLDFKKGEYALSGLDIPHNGAVSFVEQLPFMKQQNGLVGHLLGGWTVSASYLYESGQPYTPLQFFYSFGSGGVVPDTRFNNAFIGIFDNLRPFAGNAGALPTAVGSYAGDVCAFFGGSGDPSCSLAPSQLIDFSLWNSVSNGGVNPGVAKPITNKDVRYIMNGPEAQAIFGTPFGNVRRNSARDYPTNTANASIYKTTKITERVRAEFHATFLNVLNHPNFFSIDPFLEDAGLTQFETGFGNPRLWPGANPNTAGGAQRRVVLGLAFRW